VFGGEGGIRTLGTREGSLDFESEPALFQPISTRLRLHAILLYCQYIFVFFVSANRSLIHAIAKLKALKKALNWDPRNGGYRVHRQVAQGITAA
jgi:hypothetical protein